MRIAPQTVSRVLLTVAAVVSLSALVRAQGRTEVTINDSGVQAENLTSSQDGSMYFGSTAKGTIYRAAPQTLIQAEGQGRLTELTIKANRAEMRVLREGLTAATGVTIVGDTAFVLVERAKAVAVPYRPQ